MYDVIIIGAGPAGISASLYTKRANMNTLICYQENATIETATKIDNYYGFPDGISGKELYKLGIEQAENLGIKLVKEEMINIKQEENHFILLTDKNKYESKTIILALGNKKNTLKIQGLEKLEGKGISYCAICDGFFYRNKEVAVIGSGNYAIHETNDLLQIASKITILTNGENPPEIRDDKISIKTDTIKQISGDNKVEEIEFEDNSKLKVSGIFIAQGTVGSKEMSKKIGILTNNNYITVNEKMETNMPGIYACGDCTGGIFQISKSIYEGTVAGLETIKYLREEKKNGSNKN